jgi:hypothetical protein
VTGKRKHCEGIACAVVTSVALAFAVLNDAVQGQAVEKADLVEQAMARQKQVKSLDVKLKQKEVLVPGALDPGNKEFHPIAHDWTVLTSAGRLIIRGSEFRHEYATPPAQADGTFFQRDVIVASDGKADWLHYGKAPDDDGGGIGVIRPAGKYAEPTMTEAWPLLMTFRGAEARLAAYDLGRLKPTDLTSPISGVTCRRYDLPNRGASLEALWIDDGGLIWRAQREDKGKVSQHTDVLYERRYGLDSFPVAWKTVRYSPAGDVQREKTVEVVEATINGPVADSAFDVHFPPGCVVEDSTSGKAVDLVAREDGRLVERASSREEAGARGGGLWRYRWPIAAGLGGLIVVALLVQLARSRRGGSAPTAAG